MASKPTFQELLEYATGPASDVPGVVCTRFALKAAKRFGGEVFGFSQEDNPDALLGHWCGGHDFAVIGHYIVDPWLTHVFGTEKYHPVVRIGSKAALEAYGPRDKWERVPDQKSVCAS